MRTFNPASHTQESELAGLREERAGEEADAARVQAEADDLRGQNQQLNKQFAAASNEVKALKGQVGW